MSKGSLEATQKRAQRVFEEEGATKQECQESDNRHPLCGNRKKGGVIKDVSPSKEDAIGA